MAGNGAPSASLATTSSHPSPKTAIPPSPDITGAAEIRFYNTWVWVGFPPLFQAKHIWVINLMRD